MRDFHPASVSTVVAFVIVVGFVAGCFVAGTLHAYGREVPTSTARRRAWSAAIGLLAWVSLLSAVVAGGALAERPFPRLPLFMMASTGVPFALALSPLGRTFASGLPLILLVGFHGFRLPLELILHSWASQGTIPDTITWTGANPDIVTGVVALASAPFVSRSSKLAWVVNIVGLALLFNVARVAMMSSPLPFAWPLAQPLALGLHLPYAWIVPVCVGGALFGHVVLTRRLLLDAKTG